MTCGSMTALCGHGWQVRAATIKQVLLELLELLLRPIIQAQEAVPHFGRTPDIFISLEDGLIIQ